MYIGWSRLCDVHVDESDVFVAEDNIIIAFHANRLHHVSNGVTVILTGFTDEGNEPFRNCQL